MKWFRFYNEVLDDPKVQMLSPELFKFWVNILCITSKNDGVLPSIEAIAYHARASLEATQSHIKALLEAQLLQEFSNQHGSWLAPHAWAKRQYKSDVSTDRVKRFRNAKRNNIVTPPDTDTESDTEQKQIKKEKNIKKKIKITLEELSVNHVKDWLAGKRIEGKYIHHDEHHVLEVFKNYCESKGIKYDSYIAAYRNAFEWKQFQQPQQSYYAPKPTIHDNVTLGIQQFLSEHGDE